MALLGGVVSSHAPAKIGWKVAYVAGFLVMAAIAIVFVIRVSNEAESSAAKLGGKIGELQTATAETARLQRLNNQVEAQLLQLANTNTSLARKGIATVTGGDSYCYMDFIYQFGGHTPVFLHSGKYPIYDLSARIVDLEAMTRHPSLDAIMGNNVEIGEMQVGRTWSKLDWSIPFTDEQSQDFNIFFSARNGVWTEKLRLRKVRDHWSNALQVWLSPLGTAKPPAKPILEKVANDFPRNAQGTIDWDAPSK